MDAATFLHLLFGDAAGPDALMSIWTLPDKRTRWFEDCGDAAKFVRQEDEIEAAASATSRTAVYFGCGLYRPGITSGRGKADDVVGIVGLWADVDCGPPTKGMATPRTEGKNRPPTLEAASDLIARLGVQPSIVVHSGHGLQPWWLFKEFLPVADGAAQLAELWGRTIKAVAFSDGYAVDSVWDLARVLRPPGTMNRKAEPVKVTAVGSEPLLRYEPDDIKLMCWVPSKTLPVVTSAQPPAGTLDLRPGRRLTVDLQQIEQRTAIDKRFEATWSGKRKDLPDGSPSSFDMALAHIGVLLEWNDQQIADLIFLWRTIRGLDPQKACRPDYIRETIRKARQRQEEEQAAEQITEPVKAEEIPKPDDPTDPRRAPILAKLQTILRLPIIRWVQYGTVDADYTLVLEGGQEVVIGPVKAVTNQTRFRDVVYEATGILPMRKKGATWDGVCRRLAVIRETVENPEEGRVFEVLEWVTGCLGSGEGRHIHKGDLNAAIEKRAPFRRSGRLHISLNALWEHLVARPGTKHLTKQMLRKQMRAAGFVSTPVTATKKGIKPQRYWRDDRGHYAENAVGKEATQCSQKEA